MMVDFGKYGNTPIVHATAIYSAQNPQKARAATQAMIDTSMLDGDKVSQAVIDHASLDLKTPAHMGSYYGGMVLDPVGSLKHLGTEIIDGIFGINGVTQGSSGSTSGGRVKVN
jgi:hypothetical protein